MAEKRRATLRPETSEAVPAPDSEQLLRERDRGGGKAPSPPPAPPPPAPGVIPPGPLQRLLASKRHQVWLVLSPLVLYVAALNPFFLPAVYDNIVYYFGAVSLATEGSFKFRGGYVVDWPPGFSALLAIPFSLGGQSVLIAKICVLLCVAAGLILALRLFQKEQRPAPLLTVILFALLPLSFLMGTRIMSEWPYFMASMLFLHALQRLREPDRGVLPAVYAGLCLGFASLTRFVGILLGAAILAQIIEKLARSEKRPALRTVLPELTTTLIGGGLFLAWKAKILWQIHAGTVIDYDYYQSGLVPVFFGQFDPFTVPNLISDLFFHSHAVGTLLGWKGWTADLVFAVPGLVVLLGMVVRLISKERSPSDWYVLAIILLFISIKTNQQTRYLLPIAPFLISYGFVGCKQIVQWLHFREPWRYAWPARLAAAMWILMLVGSALQVLFIGNLRGTYRALSFLVSRTPESFYQGVWLDYYQACQLIKQDPTPGSVAAIGGDDKYITAFAGRRQVKFDPAQEFSFLLVFDETQMPQQQVDALNLRPLKRYPHLVLYKREPRSP